MGPVFIIFTFRILQYCIFFQYFSISFDDEELTPAEWVSKKWRFYDFTFWRPFGRSISSRKAEPESVKFNKTCENKENCVGPRRKPHIARAKTKTRNLRPFFFPHDRDSFLVNNPKKASCASDIVWSFSGPPKGLLRIRVFIRNACSNLNSSFRGQGRRSLQSSKQAVH